MFSVFKKRDTARKESLDEMEKRLYKKKLTLNQKEIELERRIREFEARLNQEIDIKAALQSEIASLETTIKQKKYSIKRLTDIVKTQREEVTNAENNRKITEQQCLVLQEKKREIEREVQVLKNRYEQLKGDNQNILVQNESLADQIKEKSNELTELTKKISQEEERMRHQIETTKAEIATIHTTLEKLQDEVRSGRITLNVGGYKYQCYVKTLIINSSYFKVMFSGRFSIEPDEEGCFFIDRDGELFKPIMQFMRGEASILIDGVDYEKVNRITSGLMSKFLINNITPRLPYNKSDVKYVQTLIQRYRSELIYYKFSDEAIDHFIEVVGLNVVKDMELMPFYFLNVGGECRTLPTKVLMYSEMFKDFFEKDNYLNYFECDREGRILINEDPKLFYQLFNILNVMDSSITKDMEMALYNNNKECGIQPMIDLATRLLINKLNNEYGSYIHYMRHNISTQLKEMFLYGKRYFLMERTT